MVNKMYLDQDTYDQLIESKKEFQAEQLKNIRDGVQMIRNVLEYEGFHADGTSEKLGMMLDVIESKWIPKLESYFEDEEAVADQFLQIVSEVDTIQ